jgi:hypothetical protein
VSTNGSTAGLLALVIVGSFAAASPAWADRPLTNSPRLDNRSSPQGYGGNITWLESGPGIPDPPRIILYRDGQVRELRLSGDTNGLWGTTPFDLGPDADGKPVAAFAACEASRRRCAIKSHDLATDQERTIKTVRAPCGRIGDLSIWRDTVAFVRTEPRRSRAGNVACTWDKPSGAPNSSLVMIKARPRAKPKLVKRYRGRRGRYQTRSLSTVELSDRYLTWFSYIADDYNGSYVARVRDLRARRACTIGRGSWWKAESDYGVARPALVGEHIVWGRMFSDRIMELLRQRGCNVQSRERANEVGQLLDASTFVYEGVSPETGHLNLFLSEKLPSFVPIS